MKDKDLISKLFDNNKLNSNNPLLQKFNNQQIKDIYNAIDLSIQSVNNNTTVEEIFDTAKVFYKSLSIDLIKENKNYKSIIISDNRCPKCNSNDINIIYEYSHDKGRSEYINCNKCGFNKIYHYK